MKLIFYTIINSLKHDPGSLFPKKKEKIVPIFYLSHHLNNEEIKAWEEKITEEAMTKKDQIG